MKHCHNCGAALPDNAHWCSQCGVHLHTSPENPNLHNASNPQPGYNYNPYPQQPLPPDRGNGNKSLTVAIWVVAALLLVGIILYFFVYSGRDSGITYDDTVNDTAALSNPSDNVWSELDKLREGAQKIAETIRVIDETPRQQQETPAVQWAQRTINAKYYDSTGSYPVKITFEESSDGQIRNCVLNNVNYGNKIPLSGHSTNDGYSFSGSSDGQQVSVRFENVGGQLQGKANIAGKEITLTATIY